MNKEYGDGIKGQVPNQLLEEMERVRLLYSSMEEEKKAEVLERYEDMIANCIMKDGLEGLQLTEAIRSSLRTFFEKGNINNLGAYISRIYTNKCRLQCLIEKAQSMGIFLSNESAKQTNRKIHLLEYYCTSKNIEIEQMQEEDIERVLKERASLLSDAQNIKKEMENTAEHKEDGKKERKKYIAQMLQQDFETNKVCEFILKRLGISLEQELSMEEIDKIISRLKNSYKLSRNELKKCIAIKTGKIDMLKKEESLSTKSEEDDFEKLLLLNSDSVLDLYTIILGLTKNRFSAEKIKNRERLLDVFTRNTLVLIRGEKKQLPNEEKEDLKIQFYQICCELDDEYEGKLKNYFSDRYVQFAIDMTQKKGEDTYISMVIFHRTREGVFFFDKEFCDLWGLSAVSTISSFIEKTYKPMIQYIKDMAVDEWKKSMKIY